MYVYMILCMYEQFYVCMYDCMYVYMHVCKIVCMYLSSERLSTTSNEVCTAVMPSVHQHNPKSCVVLSSKINNQLYYYPNVTYK